MKIECPNCRLSGNINEVELPDEGRYMGCPRCKTSFHIAKPALPSDTRYLMNTCPVCQYSTFTEEMFAVCPKCGHSGKDYKKVVKRTDHTASQAPRQEPPVPHEDLEQLKRDLDAMQRSHRNPNLVAAPVEGTAEEPARRKIPEPVKWTGWLSFGAGAALFICGFVGLINYYSKDWQAILSEPLLEPLSKTRVFFSIGLMPWLHTLVAVWIMVVASQFLNLQGWARRELARCAWGGLALGVINETVGFIEWVRISSSSPSFLYCATGVIGSMIWVFVWSIPPLTLLWFLRKECILEAFPES